MEWNCEIFYIGIERVQRRASHLGRKLSPYVMPQTQEVLNIILVELCSRIFHSN